MRFIGIEPGVLVNKAHEAVKDDSFETRPTYCLRFVRQVVQAAGGDSAWPVPQGLNAAEALGWFKRNGYVMPEGTEVQNGDIVFKAPTTAVPEGHVGIQVSPSKIVENSSTKVGRVSGAKGYRTKSQFGKIVAIVRPKRQ